MVRIGGVKPLLDDSEIFGLVQFTVFGETGVPKLPSTQGSAELAAIERTIVIAIEGVEFGARGSPDLLEAEGAVMIGVPLLDELVGAHAGGLRSCGGESPPCKNQSRYCDPRCRCEHRPPVPRGVYFLTPIYVCGSCRQECPCPIRKKHRPAEPGGVVSIEESGHGVSLCRILQADRSLSDLGLCFVSSTRAK